MRHIKRRFRRLARRKPRRKIRLFKAALRRLRHFLSAAFASAHIHAFDLIEIAVVSAEIPFCIGLLQHLHRQIQAPELSVHVNLCKRVQRNIHAHQLHGVIGQIFLHPRRIGLRVVENDLVQPQHRLAADIFIELHLKAIAVRIAHPRQARIALAADAHALEFLSVNRYVCRNIFFGARVFNKPVPVLLRQFDLDRHQAIAVKQRVFIFKGHARRAALRKHHRARNANSKRQCNARYTRKALFTHFLLLLSRNSQPLQYAIIVS